MKSLILSALLLIVSTTAQAQYPPRDYPLRMEPDRGPWSVPHYPSYRSDNPLEDTWLPYRVPVRYAVVIRQEIMPMPQGPVKSPEIKPAAKTNSEPGVMPRAGHGNLTAGLTIQIKSAASIRVDRSCEPVSRSAAACSSGPYPARVETTRVSVGSAGCGLLRRFVVRIKIR